MYIYTRIQAHCQPDFSKRGGGGVNKCMYQQGGLQEPHLVQGASSCTRKTVTCCKQF